MSDFPVVFTPADTSIMREDTNLSYLFPNLNGFVMSTQPLPFLPEVKCLQLSVKGNLNEQAFAFTRNRRTQTYLLDTLYLVPLCPTYSNTPLSTPTRQSLLIKGSSAEDTKQVIYIYIPFEIQTVESSIVQVNQFEKMNRVMVSSLNIGVVDINGINLDLNKMIPSTPYQYYEIINDKKSTIIFFDTSSLVLDSFFQNVIPTNMEYNQKTTNKTFTVYESMNGPENKRITQGMEDSIYIDCMPVDLVNEDKKTYLKDIPAIKGVNGLPVIPIPNIQGLNYATDLIDQTTSYLEKSTHYILFLVFLSLMVFLIFSVKKMFSKSADNVEQDIIPLLKEIQKKVNP